MQPDARGLDGTQLAAIAQAIAFREELWRPVMRHDPAQRWFTRRYRTAEVEAWLLTWTVSQAIELHDHGGSAGAVIVVEGELVETIAEVATWPALRHVPRPRRSVYSFGPSHVHGLRNLGPGRATSIHVYSPPLRRMTFYAPEAATLAAVRVDGVDLRAAAG